LTVLTFIIALTQQCDNDDDVRVCGKRKEGRKGTKEKKLRKKGDEGLRYERIIPC
jgi:hypothetical protein